MFYDGTCGLCHRSVTFALARDHDGSRFRFAPLQGGTMRQHYPDAERRTLPDSIVIRTADGRTLVRSEAALQMARRIGGGWKVVADGLALLPRWLLDLGYAGVARLRRRLFRRPDGLCPLIPAPLRERFLP